MRSNDDIRAIINQAFRPVDCVIEIQDYESKVGCAIYPPGRDRIIPIHKEPLSKFRNGDALFQVLRNARRKVRLSGVTLDPWEYDQS